MEEMKIYVPTDVLEEMGFQDHSIQVGEFIKTITNQYSDEKVAPI